MAKEGIFAVDDEENVLELFRFNLPRKGYQVIRAKSGEETLRKIRTELPDLIVVDLMLPGTSDALEVRKALKNDPQTRDIFVAMLMAKVAEEDLQLFTQALDLPGRCLNGLFDDRLYCSSTRTGGSKSQKKDHRREAIAHIRSGNL